MLRLKRLMSLHQQNLGPAFANLLDTTSARRRERYEQDETFLQTLPSQITTYRFLDIYQMGNKAAIEKERARLKDELNRGYFADISELKKHGGKISVANKIIIPAMAAVKFPEMEVSLSDGTSLKLPIISQHKEVKEGKIDVPPASLICLSFRANSQSWEKTMDCHSPGQGLMPASFKVRTVPLDGDDFATEEVLDPDFGEAAIGRVAPVDSGLWWIILLRAYGKCSGDLSVQERIDVQTGIKMILKLCLADGFDMFPTLLVTDGSCMIDRRMGIHGHPLEIQALFYSALLCAREMLAPEDGSADLIRALNNRLVALSFHIREYYWVDMRKLNEIYRYKTEEYSYDAVNKFNIYPDQIPPWLVDWMPSTGGYLIGNLQPAHMDFRFFSLGNVWSIVSSLATKDQSHDILDLIESKWSDLVADMPLKICYPALEGQEWRIITGSDPKNTPWSYHNAGSWPTLLWQFTVACIKMGRPEIAAKAVETAEKRLSVDKWPEYYDTKGARFIGKQSRLYQTWSIAGFLVAKQLLANPKGAKILICEEDQELVNAFYCMIDNNPRKKRARKPSKKSYIV